MVLAKFGLAKCGQIWMAKSGLAKCSRDRYHVSRVSRVEVHGDAVVSPPELLMAHLRALVEEL